MLKNALTYGLLFAAAVVGAIAVLLFVHFGLGAGVAVAPVGTVEEASAPVDAASDASAPQLPPVVIRKTGDGSSADPSVLTMFRGNAERSLSAVGTVPRHPKLMWRFPTRTKLEGAYEQRGSSKLTPQSPWSGLGWTGQPVRLGDRLYFGSADSLTPWS